MKLGIYIFVASAAPRNKRRKRKKVANDFWRPACKLLLPKSTWPYHTSLSKH